MSNNKNEKENENSEKLITLPGEVVMDHEYDGIRELDNSLPRWWLIGFYLCIVFAIGYVAYYHFGDGPTLEDQVQSDMRAIEAQALKALKTIDFNDKKLAAYAKDQQMVNAGHDIFKRTCVSCHGENGQGGIGPNLTDDYWINGDGTIFKIARVIRDGVPAKGMPNWGAVLAEEDLYRLATFIRSLRGTTPAGAKAPQGQLYPAHDEVHEFNESLEHKAERKGGNEKPEEKHEKKHEKKHD